MPKRSKTDLRQAIDHELEGLRNSLLRGDLDSEFFYLGMARKWAKELRGAKGKSGG